MIRVGAPLLRHLGAFRGMCGAQNDRSAFSSGMKSAAISVAAIAFSALAQAQVEHTYEEVWTGGATQVSANAGPWGGEPTVSWPAVMGWWLGITDWPIVRLASTTSIDFDVPPHASGAPVNYRWDSWLQINLHIDGGPYWIEDDIRANEWTAGGTQVHHVHWESTRELEGGAHLMMWARGAGVQPVRVVSQVGEQGLLGSPHYDAWYVDEGGGYVAAGAAIDVETTVTASWTFDPPAIAWWDSGDVGCGAVPNSTGATGRLEIGGSPVLQDDSMFVSAWNLPPSAFGILAGGGYFGNGGPASTTLCIGPVQNTSVTRVALVQANANGEVAYRLRAADFPYQHISTQFRAYFQLWHRDATPAGSNVTNAYRVRYEPL